jgi:hypothetical protein
MTNRRLACAVVAVGLVLGACGSTSEGTSSLRAFRSSFAAAMRQLRSINVELGSAIARAGTRTDPRLAPTLSALAGRAEQEASALGQLSPPARYNSRLRALGSALIAVGFDLSTLSTAAAERERSAAESATKKLRANAVDLRLAEMTVSTSLGLPAP